MNVIISDYISYCSGVSIAVNKMYKAIAWGKKYNKKVYSLGYLIHNERVIEGFNEMGVEVIDENQIDSVEPGIIVLRAHGVKEDIMRYLIMHDFIVVDATCPIVVKEQDLIKKADIKYHVVVIGKSGHPEAIFLHSVETPHSRTLVTNVEDVDKIVTDAPLFVVIQSTFPQTKSQAILDKLKSLETKDREVVIANTLCNSTKKRRLALKDMVDDTDCMVVIGGINSSNTNGLKMYAESFNKPVFLINSVSDIPDAVYEYETVGIATGTSTPQFIIDEIVNALRGEDSET